MLSLTDAMVAILTLPTIFSIKVIGVIVDRSRMIERQTRSAALRIAYKEALMTTFKIINRLHALFLADQAIIADDLIRFIAFTQAFNDLINLVAMRRPKQNAAVICIFDAFHHHCVARVIHYLLKHAQH